MGLIENAQGDRASGQLWKARQRLEGSLPSRPADQKCLALLGLVCWEMKDQPAAGRAWYLTDDDSTDANEARSAYENLWGNRPTDVLRNLVIKAPLNSYPEAVQARVRLLIAAASDEGYEWVEPTSNPDKQRYPINEGSDFWGAVSTFIMILLLVAGVGIVGLGVVTLLQWLIPDFHSDFKTDDTYVIRISRPGIAASIVSLVIPVAILSSIIVKRRKRKVDIV